jgi:hypothetical protein
LTSGTPSTIAATYAGGLVRLGAHAYTIAQAGTTGFTTNWGTCLINEAAVGGGNATITATTSVWTGAGATTVLTLEPGASACIRSDNANYTAAVSHYSQPAGANPTGTAGSAAVNGSATTFMRSDGAPAIALGSSSTFGLVKVDNTTITASGGVITATAGGSGCTISGAAGAVFNTGSSTCTTNVDITMTAGGAAPQLILGANTATLGAIKMFGNTSGDLTINPPAVAGTASKITFPAGITDFSGTGGTSQFVKQASAGAALTVAQPAFTDISGTATNAQIPAAIFATGTTVSLTAPRQYYECTAACNVTPPVPASGYEFCVRNANNTTGAITLVNPGSSVQFENQAKTAYGTATSGTLSSAGAATDQVCIVGNGTTKYDIFSITGTWTAS